ncbi:uncharacterized protein UHOD_12395 [Ustilago sp. UG-2017b]|nr:uncharacterized protein UHOD_12395 [Ustilago sp. UG-2017b]
MPPAVLTQLDSHRVSRQTDLGFRRETPDTKHSLSTAYHPQTDGQTERVNQVVEQYLRMYCNYEQDDWADLLKTVAFVYNNTVHNSIGISPFFTCYSWNPKAHPDIPQRLGVHDPECFEYLIDGRSIASTSKTRLGRHSVGQRNNTTGNTRTSSSRSAIWFTSIAETGRQSDPHRNLTPGLQDLTQFKKEWAAEHIGSHCRQTSESTMSFMCQCSNQQKRAHSRNGRNSQSYHRYRMRTSNLKSKRSLEGAHATG